MEAKAKELIDEITVSCDLMESYVKTVQDVLRNLHSIRNKLQQLGVVTPELLAEVIKVSEQAGATLQTLV